MKTSISIGSTARALDSSRRRRSAPGRGTRCRRRSAARPASTLRIASLTIGTSSGSPPSARRTSSASHEGSSISRADRAEQALAVEHRAALQLVRPPLALAERGRRRGGDRQRLARAAPRRRRDRRRPPGARSGAASVPARRTIAALAPGDGHARAERQQARPGAGHVEAAVEPVRTADAPGLQRAAGRSTRSRLGAAAASRSAALNRRCRRARGVPRRSPRL